jgi:serine/threonine protein phosphatase PrpC
MTLPYSFGTGEDFFAVFDGHAGRASAVFAADHFHGVLAKKVMEENGQGLSAKRRGSRDKGKEKDGTSDEGKQKKGSFWNKRAAKRSRELSRVKASSGELTDVAAAERTEGKDKEEEGDMSDLSSRMSAEGEQQEAEQEQEDSDEEPINFPKGVGEDSSKEAQATFSALIKSFLEMDELMKDNRDGATAVVTLASMRYEAAFQRFPTVSPEQITDLSCRHRDVRLNKLFVANVGDARAVLCRRVRSLLSFRAASLIDPRLTMRC